MYYDGIVDNRRCIMYFEAPLGEIVFGDALGESWVEY